MSNATNGVQSTLNTKMIRAYLVGNAKTQKWLASRLKVSLRTVSYMMEGKVPHSETMERLSDLMGAPLHRLIQVQEQK